MVGPSTSIEFLGILLDNVAMKASFPEVKLNRIQQILSSYHSAKLVSKWDLLSLLGHLNFAMCIIPHGRAFISRLLQRSKSVTSLHDLVSLDEGCRSNLCSWSLILNSWNGISFFYNESFETSISLQLYTDAAPSVGFGGSFGNEWFAEKWPSKTINLPPEKKLLYSRFNLSS